MTAPRDTRSFSLANFEGPLDLLLYLVQKNELDIYDIPIQEITEQYLAAVEELDTTDVDGGAEFLSMAATLLLIKSRMLLPKQEQTEDDEEDPDPRFEIIHQLLDYCRFKQVSSELRDREERCCGFYYRGVEGATKEVTPRLGVEELSIQELEAVFQNVMERAKARGAGLIAEEEWRVPDKIRALRRALKGGEIQDLNAWINERRSQGELIVTFLAILELMKIGELRVLRSTTGVLEIHGGQESVA